MAKHFRLQHSESVIVDAAAQIYAAYISTGRVTDGQEEQWIQRSIREALYLAQATDDAVISDDEIDAHQRAESGGISMGRVRGEGGKHQ